MPARTGSDRSATPNSDYLGRTLALAERGRGSAAPNPMVGAIIVDPVEDQVIGEGWHETYGGPHAETVAIQAARETHGAAALQGATLYCNVEPCSYTARDKHQPPCTEAIIHAGIGRVVIGMIDPNPRVRGGGIRALRAAGVTVDLAPDPGPFQQFNHEFVRRMTSD